MEKKKSDYIEYLNELYSADEIMDKTEHCWAGNDKSESEKMKAYKLAQQRMYGECLQKYDPIAFQVGFNEWKL